MAIVGGARRVAARGGIAARRKEADRRCTTCK
jgi:hypothetical protein